MKRTYLAALVATLLVAAACGGGEASDTTDSDAATQTETTAAAPSTSQAESTDAGAASSGADSTATTTAEPATTTSGATNEDQTATAGGATLGASVLQGKDPEITSARFEANFTIVPAPGSATPEVTMMMEGEFDSVTGNSRFFMDFGSILEAASPEDLQGAPPELLEIFEDPMEMITVGDTAYMKWGFFNVLLGADGWIEMPASETGSVTSDFGFGSQASSPADLLNQLRDANAEIEDLGQETVRNVETTHYRAVLDLEQLAESMTPEERAELEDQFGAVGIGEFPIELWVSDDGLVYRYVIELDSSAVADMEDVQSMTMMFELYDYGATIEVMPPDPSEVTSIEELGGFFGTGG